MNYKADRVLKTLAVSPPGDVLEIGCIREKEEVPEDGFSTPMLAAACFNQGRKFVSVDNNEKHVEIANECLSSHGLTPSVLYQDAMQYLEEHKDVAHALIYYDSHRDPSYTLEQYVNSSFVPGGYVVVDDCHSYDNWMFGKGTSLIELFIKHNIKFDLYNTHPGYKMLVAKLENGKKFGKEF